VLILLLSMLLAKYLSSLISIIFYSTYLLLTSVDSILVVWLASVNLERGDVKNLYSPFLYKYLLSVFCCVFYGW